MRFDFDQMPTEMVYKMMSACIFPRPIAWITTLNKDDSVNAAPFSFFNMMGSEPPTLTVGLLAKPDGDFKDTAQNILERGEFVVNVVTKELAPSMNQTSIDAPRGVNELAYAGLTSTLSDRIATPRIAESPISFECVSIASLVTGPMQTIVVGRVLAMQARSEVIQDASRGHMNAEALDLIGRTFASGYTTTRDRFDLTRPAWVEKSD